MEEIVAIIMAVSFGGCMVLVTLAFTVRSLFSRPGRREIRELRERVEALEQQRQQDSDRLETVRNLVLSNDAEARRRLAEALESREAKQAPEEAASSRLLRQRAD